MSKSKRAWDLKVLECYRDEIEEKLSTCEERENEFQARLAHLDAQIEKHKDTDIMNGVERATHEAYVASKHRTAVEDYASSPNTPSRIASPPGVIGEKDPHGITAHTAGAKMDAGKPLAGSCIAAFAKALRGVIDVYTFGAEKYCVDGWEKVPDGENRYRDALYRHLLAHEETPLDADSGMSHLAHACWNLLAWSELVLRKQGIESDSLREGINEDAGC